jgi:plastocyanin
MSLVLISDDGLWDDQTVYYGKAFSYTFEEAGTYRFSVQDNPAIAGTIVVT